MAGTLRRMDDDRLPDLYRGDTWDFDIEVTDNGNAVDISGAELWFTAKPDSALDTAGDTSAIVQARSGALSGPDATLGKHRLTVPSTATAQPPGSYKADFQIVYPGSPPRVYTLWRTSIKILSDVTRNVE